MLLLFATIVVAIFNGNFRVSCRSYYIKIYFVVGYFRDKVSHFYCKNAIKQLWLTSAK